MPTISTTPVTLNDGSATVVRLGNTGTVRALVTSGSRNWPLEPGFTLDVRTAGLAVTAVTLGGSTTVTVDTTGRPPALGGQAVSDLAATVAADPILSSTFAATGYAASARRYVSPYGSDSNDGRSEGAAFLTPAAAYAALPAGGEVIMLPGVHVQPAGQTMQLVTSGGVVNKPATFIGAGQQRTIWRRSSDLTLLRLLGVESTSGAPADFVNEVKFREMTLDGAGFDAGGPGYGSNMVELIAVNHVIFQDVRFYNVAGTGVYGSVVENSKFQNCRYSSLATTVGGNKAGTELVNGPNLETNGVRWESCDFEVTYGGRDIHALGSSPLNVANLVVENCKFESATAATGYAPSQRVFLEYADDVLVSGSKFIRGQGTQLDFSLCNKTRVIGSNFHDGQGQYAVHYRDGGYHVIDDCQFQGSAAMSAAGGAHLRIGATADVKRGLLRHLVVGSELRVDDQSSQGRQVVMVPDELGTPLAYQKTGYTAGAAVNMGTIAGAAVDYVIPRAGRLVALTMLANAGMTAGTCMATVQKNGVDTSLTTVIDTTNTAKKYTDLGWASGVPVAAGDTVRVTLTGSGSAAPTTQAINAVAYFVPTASVV